MGTMDYLNRKLDEAVERTGDAIGVARRRAGSFVADHEGQAGSAIDRAARFVDQRTEGKYAPHVARVSRVARSGVRVAAGQPARTEHPDGGTSMRGGQPYDGTTMSGPAR